MKTRRLRQDPTRPRVGRAGGRVAERAVINGVTYVLTYIVCGPRCSRCTIGGANHDPDRPGHGPYWYMWVTRRDGRPIRKYVGRDLEAYLAAKAQKKEEEREG